MLLTFERGRVVVKLPVLSNLIAAINHEEIEAISQIVNDKYLHTLACTGFVGLSPHKIIAYLTILVFRRTIYTPRLLV